MHDAQKDAHTSIQVQRRHSDFPCAMALRLIRVRPGDRLSCHHHLRELSLPHDLTPAPGRQAHTTSPYALATLVFAAFASIASHPASVTIAKRPPSGTGPRRCIADLGSRSSTISENQKLESILFRTSGAPLRIGGCCQQHPMTPSKSLLL